MNHNNLPLKREAGSFTLYMLQDLNVIQIWSYIIRRLKHKPDFIFNKHITYSRTTACHNSPTPFYLNFYYSSIFLTYYNGKVLVDLWSQNHQPEKIGIILITKGKENFCSMHYKIIQQNIVFFFIYIDLDLNFLWPKWHIQKQCNLLMYKLAIYMSHLNKMTTHQ